MSNAISPPTSTPRNTSAASPPGTDTQALAFTLIGVVHHLVLTNPADLPDLLQRNRPDRRAADRRHRPQPRAAAVTMLTQATGPPPNHAQQGNPAGQPLNGSAEAGTGTTRICERGRLGFSGVSVIAAITTRYMPSYTVPAAKMGHAEVVFDVGMVFPVGAVTMRQWPFRAGHHLRRRLAPGAASVRNAPPGAPAPPRSPRRGSPRCPSRPARWPRRTPRSAGRRAAAGQQRRRARPGGRNSPGAGA